MREENINKEIIINISQNSLGIIVFLLAASIKQQILDVS